MISAITSMAGGLVAVGQHLCGFIYPKIKSMIRFRSNLEKLRKEMGNLLSLGNNLKGQIEAAERSGHVAAPAVTKWLEEFENIKNEVNSIEASVESNGGKCCPTTPSCCLGCTLGVKVDKNLIGVRRLIEATGHWVSK
ncbi:hypothetical protein LOK49_LG07G03290 [Camellia lanceoleosa]|uniref:Uncharacterized protein n=1 Tax=Camellia lanceoleosa TaxID=1840588 RepID=A0ACC0GXZ4_9ERIC|nr:hypothetical protein LOK49_LG07G03290 [Camellia lanceoleosa]